MVTFVPFLRPSAVSGMAQVDGGHAPLLADLALWGYSDQLTDQLREHLPHRAARVVVAKGGSHQAMQELGLGDWEAELALLDVWSFGVGMVTFVDRLRAVDDVSWSQVREDLTSNAAKQLWLTRATGLGAGPVGGRPRPSVREDAGAPLWTQQMIECRCRTICGHDVAPRSLASPPGPPCASCVQSPAS